MSCGSPRGQLLLLSLAPIRRGQFNPKIAPRSAPYAGYTGLAGSACDWLTRPRALVFDLRRGGFGRWDDFRRGAASKRRRSGRPGLRAGEPPERPGIFRCISLLIYCFLCAPVVISFRQTKEILMSHEFQSQAAPSMAFSAPARLGTCELLPGGDRVSHPHIRHHTNQRSATLSPQKPLVLPLSFRHAGNCPLPSWCSSPKPPPPYSMPS